MHATLAQVNTLTAANIYRPLGIDNSWDLEEFKQNFSIKITKMVDDMMEFEMMGKDVDAATHVGDGKVHLALKERRAQRGKKLHGLRMPCVDAGFAVNGT